MASDRDLKTLSRQRMTCSAGDGAPAQRFSADERLRAAPLEPREGLSQAKTLLPLGRSVSKKRTMYTDTVRPIGVRRTANRPALKREGHAQSWDSVSRHTT